MDHTDHSKAEQAPKLQDGAQQEPAQQQTSKPKDNAPPQPDDKSKAPGEAPEHGPDDDRELEDALAKGEVHPSKGGAIVLGFTVLLAFLLASLAIGKAVLHPRTDDAEIFANYIGMAPQVEGPIVSLPIHDNQFVKTGDLLFVVDERPFRYALERALSDQAALEGQIEDRQRMINSQISGVHVATANIRGSASNREAMRSTIAEAEADVVDDRAAVQRAEADRQYAEDNLHRLEPLLAEQYVTADQVDQARTLLKVRTREVQQAQAQVALAEAQVRSNASRFAQSEANVEQSQAQRDQAANGVQTLAPLTLQREQRAAAVRTAQYNLNNCRVYAPFDGYVTNLTISVGNYVRVGSEVFTMIDARNWWVIANFRETQLKHVLPGAKADVFLLSRETQPLEGTVQSVGYGVTPDTGVFGTPAAGLPAVQRTLNWVHLSARYPVRIRIDAPPPGLLRVGQSAVAVVYPPGSGAEGR